MIPFQALPEPPALREAAAAFFLFCGFYVLEHGKMPEICRVQGCLNAVLEHFLYFF